MKQIILGAEQAQFRRFRVSRVSFSLTLILRRIFRDRKGFGGFDLAPLIFILKVGLSFQKMRQTTHIFQQVLKYSAVIVVGTITLLSLIHPAFAQEGDVEKRALVRFARDVLVTHPALQAAQAELNAARARGRAFSNPIYYPELELEYEDAADKTKTIGLNQSFDFSGKRGARREVASADVLSAQLNVNVVRTNLLSELMNALINYDVTKRDYEFENKRVRLASEFYNVDQKLYESGDLDQNELLTAKLSYASAQVSLSNATNSLSDAVAQLVGLTGQDRSEWPELPPKPDIIPSFDLSVLDNLPHLRLAKSRSQTNRSLIKLAQRERFPDPTFGLRYGNEGSANLVGLQFSIPIPVRNTYSAEVKAATEEATATDLTYAELYRRARANFIYASRRYEALLKTWNIWEAEGVVTLQQQTNLLERLLQIGELNAVNYLVLLNQTLDAEAQAIELHDDLWRSRILWLEASGSLNEWMEIQ